MRPKTTVEQMAHDFVSSDDAGIQSKIVARMILANVAAVIVPPLRKMVREFNNAVDAEIDNALMDKNTVIKGRQ